MNEQTVDRLDLEHTEPSAAERVLRQVVTSGRTTYVGISAGAALAGPDLRFFRDGQDPGRVISTTGLDLVPFTVLPHRNRGNADRHDRHALRHGRRNRFISINDDQAVTVHGNSWKIQESP